MRALLLNDLITLDLAGKANNRPGFYRTDKNNFAPTISVAYSPDFGNNFFGRALGRDGRSVIRGGFRMIYDRVGSALAVNFDLNNSLGFASSTTISANTFDVSGNPGPLLTGTGQNVRALPGIGAPMPIRFPLTNPADEQQRIEQAIDENLTTPVQYTYNVSYGRELPKGFSFEASYVGRNGRNLLVTRDAMHLNNLRDPASGQDWYTAARILTDLRNANTPLANVPRIPYFENLFPGFTRVQPGSAPLPGQTLTPSQNAYRQVARPAVGGRGIIDYTFVQLILDDRSRLGRNAFFHPQYAALGTYSTIGTADYTARAFPCGNASRAASCLISTTPSRSRSTPDQTSNRARFTQTSLFNRSTSTRSVRFPISTRATSSTRTSSPIYRLVVTAAS
jgi:hypothetical protein